MPRAQADVLPVLVLPKGTVLLPGIAQKVLIPSTSPEIPALIAAVYEKAASEFNNQVEAVPIACFPRCSPLISPQGRLLIGDGESDGDGPLRPDVERESESGARDLFAYGVAGSIVGIEGSGSGDFAIRVQPISRLRLQRVTVEEPFLQAKVMHLQDNVPARDAEFLESYRVLQLRTREMIAALKLAALFRNARSGIPLPARLPRRLESAVVKRDVQDAGAVADMMTTIAASSLEEKLQVLAAIDVKQRVAKAVEILEGQSGSSKNRMKITTFTAVPIPLKVNDRSSRGHNVPPFFGQDFGEAGGKPARQSGGDGAGANELDELRKRLEAAGLPPDSLKMALREVGRLQQMTPVSQEYQVVHNWLEVLADIPWSRSTEARLDQHTMSRARRQLDDDHYGLDKVKKRILEYLAVLRLKQTLSERLEGQPPAQDDAVASSGHGNPRPGAGEEAARKSTSRVASESPDKRRYIDKSPIMLLVGPPGVGKTSLARSVASALGRKFHRISLGGVRDEAEIRGHRRTYVAAMPGVIVQGLRKVGVNNPVMLLDEIDKLSASNFHGDPSAAMLEVLDPEQNNSFTDHYVGVPIDLSKVLFLATANNVESIPPALLDRLEMIFLPGYTTLEKRHIASRHLVPKQVRSNGLTESSVDLGEDVISKIIESYTRESGVRSLEREIGSVCRAKAVEYADANDSGTLGSFSPRVTPEDLERILGAEKFVDEIAEKSSRPGIVTGLVAYSFGGTGSILFVEVADMPGTGQVQLTGQLGSVLQESVGVALSWVKSHAFDLGLTDDAQADIMFNRNLHVHCPSGAIPKDGPSSGIAQAIAMISLFSGKPVPPSIAMTGEISLRGRITAVGGIKEKLIGALRAGVRTVLLPSQNRKDLKELPQEVTGAIKIFPVSHIWEAIRLVWPDWKIDHDDRYHEFESRL